jgi:hypothetical protein
VATDDDDDDENAGAVLEELDAILAEVDIESSPWVEPVHPEYEGQRVYVPDYDLARRLLAVPISQGYAKEQQSGRVAKALDAWIAAELRRAGFPPDAVWPRSKRPRVLPGDLVPVETAVAEALTRLDEFEARLRSYASTTAKKGVKQKVPSLYRVRPAIRNVLEALPGEAAAHILGRFYVKQVDVVVSTWQRGPDVLVSSKTAFSSYLKNKNNRYEEAVGEVTNLRDRHPRAATGFAFLVRTNIFEEVGAFAYLRDLLVRLRKPDGDFDATMLLAGDWNDVDLELGTVDDPAEILSAPRFFADLLNAVMTNAPVDLHQELRRRKQGEPPGGLPPLDETVAPEQD